MSKPIILVTGATGKTGLPTALGLLERGFPVRAFIHSRDARADRLRQAGAELTVGSLENYRDLAIAMTDVGRAYFCPPLEPGTLRRATFFAVAAREAKLEAVVYLSQWVSDAIHPALNSREKWLTNQVFSSLAGLGAIAIQPGWFADNYFAVLGQAAQFGMLALPAWRRAQRAALERGHRPRNRRLPRQSRAARRQMLSSDGAEAPVAQRHCASHGRSAWPSRQICGRADAHVSQGGRSAQDSRLHDFAALLVPAGLSTQRVRNRRADKRRRGCNRRAGRGFRNHRTALRAGFAACGARSPQRATRGRRAVFRVGCGQAERREHFEAAGRAAPRGFCVGPGLRLLARGPRVTEPTTANGARPAAGVDAPATNSRHIQRRPRLFRHADLVPRRIEHYDDLDPGQA